MRLGISDPSFIGNRAWADATQPAIQGTSQMSIFTTSAAVVAATLVAAYAAGQFMSASIHTEIEIEAPAQAVWAVLSDTRSYPDWNPFVRKISGDLAVGARLAVTIQPEGNSPMDFTPLVLVADVDRELRWLGRMGVRGIFDGEHHFVIAETARGTTVLRHGETFRGMLTPLVMFLIRRDTEAGFEAMNAALKHRAEAAAQS